MSSGAYEASKDGISFDDINFEQLPDATLKQKMDSGFRKYSQSKLANILHAKELAKKLESTGISVYVLHPGFKILQQQDKNIGISIFSCLSRSDRYRHLEQF